MGCAANTGGRRNPACSECPIDFIGKVTADFYKMQPRDVLGRVRIRCVRHNISDEHRVGNPLELWNRPRVPDRRDTSGPVVDEIVLAKDRV